MSAMAERLPCAPAAPAHLLEIGDLDAARLEALLDAAAACREQPDALGGAPVGGAVVCLFEKPSTRTRVSVQVAAHRLGLLPVVLRPDELQLERGEPLEDTARVLAGYACAIVARVKRHETLERLASAGAIPVVNALSDLHHPLQALADLLTLRDLFGELQGLRLAYVGDANNVCVSLLHAGALAGLHLRVAAPAGYRPDPTTIAEIGAVAAGHGGSVTLVEDPHEAVAGADAVYTDVWVSMGDEDEREQRLQDLAPYAVTPALMALADPNAVFLHCLPAHRGEEVDADVLDGARSHVFAQAANRLPTTQAVLHQLVTQG